MRRLLFAYVLVCAAVFASWQCFSQTNNLLLLGVGGPKGSASYSGPCDTATISGGCTSAVGFLSGTAAYSTALSPAVDICDTATCTTTATIHFLATGYWDAATAAASAPCTVACSPSKFYDSTGNGNALPVSGTAYGQISFNVLGSCSGLIHTVISGPSASNPYYLSSTFTTLTQPYSLITLAERIGNTTTVQIPVASSSGGAVGLGFNSTANTLVLYASSNITLGSVADGSPHAIIGIADGASSTVSADGTTSSAQNAGTQTASTFAFGSDPYSEELTGSSYAVFGAIAAGAVNPTTVSTKVHTLCGGF